MTPNSHQAFKSRHVWLRIVGVSLLLALIYPAYLKPLVSPQKHLRDLPIAVVDEDTGAAGQDFGAQVLESLTSRELRAIQWTTLPDRHAAAVGIERGDFYAAIVIPSDYSRTLLARIAPPTSSAAPSRVPEPATVEILTNPAAGPAQASAAQAAAEEAVDRVSDATAKQLPATLAAQETARPPHPRALLTTQLLLEDPIHARITEVEPLGPNSARGLTPAYLTFLAALSALMGSGAIHFGLLQSPAYRTTSRIALWTARLVLAIPLALFLAALETGAVRVLGIEHDAPTLALFAMLAALIYASMAVVSLLVAHLGPAGLVLGAVFNVVLGQISSGGATPLETLPPSYAALADWLPFSRAADAVRALLFYGGGTRDVVTSALVALGAYLVIATLLGYAIALAQDLFRRRTGKAGIPNRARKEEPIEA